MTKSKEYDLRLALDIARDYSLKDSTVDSGNLFFALNQFTAAYDDLLGKYQRTISFIDEIAAPMDIYPDQMDTVSLIDQIRSIEESAERLLKELEPDNTTSNKGE